MLEPLLEGMNEGVLRGERKLEKLATKAMNDVLGWTQLFKMFDKDSSGFIDFTEFGELCKYMGLFLNKEALLVLFSEADKSGNNQIEFDEFTHAMLILKREIAMQALAKLGFSRQDIMTLFVMLCGFLLLVFVFIFVGIAAFSTATSFNAVINSLIPAGAGTSLGGQTKFDMQKLKGQLKGSIEKVLAQMSKK